jgi:hypothetical protein
MKVVVPGFVLEALLAKRFHDFTAMPGDSRFRDCNVDASVSAAPPSETRRGPKSRRGRLRHRPDSSGARSVREELNHGRTWLDFNELPGQVHLARPRVR